MHVTIAEPEALVMPQQCVVCGSDNTEFLQYAQEHMPLIWPGLSIHRKREIVLPYCDLHAKAHRRRFARLHLVQNSMIACLFLCGIPGMILFENFPDAKTIGALLAGVATCSLFLLPLTLVVRRRLYDAFFSNTRHGLRISSRHSGFIETVKSLNEDRHPDSPTTVLYSDSARSKQEPGPASEAGTDFVVDQTSSFAAIFLLTLIAVVGVATFIPCLDASAESLRATIAIAVPGNLLVFGGAYYLAVRPRDIFLGFRRRLWLFLMAFAYLLGAGGMIVPWLFGEL